MSLQARRVDRDEAKRSGPEAGRRFRLGLLAGAAPHLGLTTLALLSYATARNNEEREFAVMPVFLELALIPTALILVLLRAVPQRTRSWAKGLAGGTGVGLLVVALLIAWHSGASGT